ncbi:MAG: tetratricopeptide repeat protein [Caulobacterales bacterium]
MANLFVDHAARLKSLLGYLESDPGNLSLLSDAAETALAAHDPKRTLELLEAYAAHAPLPPQERNLAGLAALQAQDYPAAVQHFEALLPANAEDVALRFNLAWSLAMTKNFERALELLDPATVEALPQAAMLHLQLLHNAGHLDEAAEASRAHILRHPTNEGLLAAASVLAIDLEDLDLARDCAIRSGEHPDALTTLGTLSLNDENPEAALEQFERALAKNPYTPRAWVGKGLAELLSGQGPQAARDIEHGAQMFDTHIGSWIAAGWAHVLSNDLVAAQNCFDKALSIDANFAESHGSLAVLDFMNGNFDSARRLAQTALRLDSKSFAGALAQSLVLSHGGRNDAARAIVERALHTPLGENGQTIAQALAKYVAKASSSTRMQ